MRAHDVRARVVAVAVAHRRPVGVQRLHLGRALGVGRPARAARTRREPPPPRAAPARAPRPRRSRPARRSSEPGRSRARAGRANSSPYVFCPGTSSCVSTAWTPGSAARGRDVDLEDARVRVRAAHGLAPEHPGGLQVARVRELAGDLRDRVGAAPALAARPRRSGRRRAVLIAPPPGAPRRGSSGTRCSGRGCPTAPRGSRRRSDPGSRRSRSAAATTKPGVQKPHCTAPVSANASCTGCSCRRSRAPRRVDDLVAVRLRGENEARAHELAVEQHRARAALALLARVLRAGQLEALAQRIEQALARPDVGLEPLAVDSQRDPHASTPLERARREDAQGVAAVGGRPADVVDRARRGGDRSGNSSASSSGAQRRARHGRRRPERRAQLAALAVDRRARASRRRSPSRSAGRPS